ncbi:hypothetical protein CHAN_11995 [Corynebacterium hansenii]|nr:hypothetical protein CHAN_11995 [Corynebacterium hansenii]
MRAHALGCAPRRGASRALRNASSGTSRSGTNRRKNRAENYPRRPRHRYVIHPFAGRLRPTNETPRAPTNPPASTPRTAPPTTADSPTSAPEPHQSPPCPPATPPALHSTRPRTPLTVPNRRRRRPHSTSTVSRQIYDRKNAGVEEFGPHSFNFIVFAHAESHTKLAKLNWLTIPIVMRTSQIIDHVRKRATTPRNAINPLMRTNDRSNPADVAAGHTARIAISGHRRPWPAPQSRVLFTAFGARPTAAPRRPHTPPTHAGQPRAAHAHGPRTRRPTTRRPHTPPTHAGHTRPRTPTAASGSRACAWRRSPSRAATPDPRHARHRCGGGAPRSAAAAHRSRGTRRGWSLR